MFVSLSLTLTGWLHGVRLPNRRFATVFTFNTLLSLAVQTVIQVVTGSRVLQLPIQVRFGVFATVWGAFVPVCVVCFAVVWYRTRQQQRSLDYELPV